MNRTLRVVLALLALAAARGFCEPGVDDGRSDLLFDVNPRMWGGNVGVGYRGLEPVSGLDTILWVYGGGAYESLNFWRNSDDGSLIVGAGTARSSTGKASFDRAGGEWQLGAAQGILWNARKRGNLLEGFLFLRGRAYFHLEDSDSATGQLVFLSGLPDARGSLQNSLFAGLSFDDAFLDARTKVLDGISAELSAEWGPRFLWNGVYGGADFLRLNATARFFLPLFDADPAAPWNVFAVGLADFASVDWTAGTVPAEIARTFGGRDARKGLGGAVRGIDSASADAVFKAVNNLEMRASLPALFLKDIVPGFVAYVDAGWYDNTGSSVSGAGQKGFLASAGCGVSLNVLDITTLVAYTHYRLTGANADGSAWTPFAFDLALHF